MRLCAVLNRDVLNRDAGEILNRDAGEIHVHDSNHHFNSAADRSLANVALQLRLGLLSRWRPWPYPDHSDHLGTHGADLSVCQIAAVGESPRARRVNLLSEPVLGYENRHGWRKHGQESQGIEKGKEAS